MVRSIGARLAVIAIVLGVMVPPSVTPAVAATTATTLVASSRVAFPVQSLGDRGTDVLAIQHLVRFRLSSMANTTAQPLVDGYFGATTMAAVKAVQAGRGLPATGIVNGATWAGLASTLALGSSGEAVLALQVELVEKRRAVLAVDGVFGATTKSAVVAFQKRMGLPQTGVVNIATWRALTWHFELPHFNVTSLCDYSVGNGPANWGTSEAIATLEAVGRRVFASGDGRVAVGDISLELGGNIAGHESHERGLDVDVRPLRNAENQCTIAGTRWSSTAYDRAATRAMILAFRSFGSRHIKVIWFNDPVLIREGLTRWHRGHDDHVHVRFCEAFHPLAAYDC